MDWCHDVSTPDWRRFRALQKHTHVPPSNVNRMALQRKQQLHYLEKYALASASGGLGPEVSAVTLLKINWEDSIDSGRLGNNHTMPYHYLGTPSQSAHF
jgi:hypothetical protein